MEDTLQLRQTVIAKLSVLPEEKLLVVVDFIDFLLERSGLVIPQKPVAPQGNLDDLLACAGTWEFEPGELEEILHEVVTSDLEQSQ